MKPFVVGLIQVIVYNERIVLFLLRPINLMLSHQKTSYAEDTAVYFSGHYQK